MLGEGRRQLLLDIDQIASRPGNDLGNGLARRFRRAKRIFIRVDVDALAGGGRIRASGPVQGATHSESAGRPARTRLRRSARTSGGRRQDCRLDQWMNAWRMLLGRDFRGRNMHGDERMLADESAGRTRVFRNGSWEKRNPISQASHVGRRRQGGNCSPGCACALEAGSK